MIIQEYTPTNREKNRGLVRGSIKYVSTPLFRSKIITRNYLLRRHNGSSAYEQPRRVAHNHKVGGSCSIHTDHYESTIGPVWCAWDNLSHEGTGSVYNVNQFDSSELSDALTAVQNEVSKQALTSYDFLTDIAEAREIPGLVRSVSGDLMIILRTLRGHYSLSDLRRAAYWPIKDLLKHPSKVFRKLGDEWMQYRYAIMPLVYSYRDIQKTVNRGIDNTARCSRTIMPKNTGVNLPASTTDYVWKAYTGNIVIRGHIFSHYDWDVAARVAGLGMNPLVTAWELIPYSFVVDWFVNVGDYITRTTSTNLASARTACFSRREQHNLKTWQHYHASDIILTVNRLSGTWSAGDLPPVGSVTINRPEESQILQDIETNSYSRYLFNPRDAQLTINPSLNWRRWIDSAAMANNLLRSFIKIFKR